MSLRQRFIFLIITFLLISPVTFSQKIDGEALCEIIEAHTMDGTEACLANRSENPSDKSFVIVARKGIDLQVFLLRSDLNGGGDCKAIEGNLRSFRCLSLKFENPPDYNAICNYGSEPIRRQCTGNARVVSYYNVATHVVPPGTGGVNAVASKSLFAAARGLRIKDVSVTKMGDTLLYREAAVDDKTPLRIARTGEISPTMAVRSPVDSPRELDEVLAHIDAENIPLNDLVSLGLEGRFVARNGGKQIYYGTAGDCDGSCTKRELLSKTAFKVRLRNFANRVPIERQTPELRKVLIDRLLLGNRPYKPVDNILDTARVRQPPAFLVLRWD